MVVVTVVMVMCIREEWNLCWFHPQACIPMTTISQYVIAGPLQVLPTQLLTTLSTGYCPKKNVNYFGLRRLF